MRLITNRLIQKITNYEYNIKEGSRMITKNLIFSHKSDIDGMGCVVLTKLALEEKDSKVDYVLCEGHNIDEVFEKYFLSQKLILYDRIFVTDLHLNEDNLKLIESNNILKSKVKVIDHNDYALRYNNYDFVNIQIKLDNGLDSCATTLLYNYYIKEGLLQYNDGISKFCEATRRQDTGTWKLALDEHNTNYARDLSILFGAIGQDRYIDIMYNKLRSNDLFFLDEPERNIVYHKGEIIKARVTSYLKDMKIKDISGKKAGIFRILYEDRNELAQYIRNNQEEYKVDFIVLIPYDKNTISLRNINPECNVGKIAETMNGKGHFGAAGINLTDSNKDELLHLFG